MMIKGFRLASVASVLAALLALAAISAAQEAPRQQTGGRARAGRPEQKPATGEAEKPATEPAAEAPEVSLGSSLSALATQIGVLTSEVRRLRQETQRNAMMLELLLYEERLAKVEEKLDAAMEQKINLDAREQEIQRRQRNIQQELVLRGGGALRRDEAEAAIRADLQRALEDTRNQQAAYQQRISELQAQAERLRRHVESLRKKLDREEEKSEPSRQ